VKIPVCYNKVVNGSRKQLECSPSRESSDMADELTASAACCDNFGPFGRAASVLESSRACLMQSQSNLRTAGDF
jgi:hypothetical protein